MKSKIELRKRMLRLRDGLSIDYRTRSSNEICKELINLVSLNSKNFKVVHCFIPIGSEVNIRPFIQTMLENDIKIVAPKTLTDRVLENRVLTSLKDLEKGVFGTFHPSNSKEYVGPIDLCIIPGAAFDLQMNRLGYGGGYYDTLLAKYSRTKKIAVCFKEQLIANVPVEPHDIKMDQVIC